MRRALLVGVALGGAIAAAVGALALAGGPTPPVLRSDPEVDVVHVTAPAMATGAIDLHNDSTASITVASVTRDPSCDPEVTTTFATPATIPAGSSQSVAIGCAGTITAGMKRCLLRALGTTGELLAELEAVCEGGNATTLAAAPNALDFGDVAIGNAAALPISLTSSDGVTVAKLFLQTTDLDNTFMLAAPCNPDARQCDAAIKGIMNGGTAEIGVTCRPTSVGTQTAQLRIASETGAYVGTPITLTCTGTAAAGPVLAVTGDPVDAGGVEVSGDVYVDPRPLRLRNAGTGNVVLTGVQVIDAGDGAANDWHFTVRGACTGAATACSLRQDDIAEIALRFEPMAIGPRPAVLVIGYTEAGTARSLAIPLSGIGRGATITRLGAGPLNFGSVPLAMTSTLDVTLVNGGNRDATVMITPMTPGPPYVPAPPASVVVEPGVKAIIPISCRPTSAGESETTFRFTSTEATLPLPLEIVATCTGITGPLFANPTTLDLGELRTGAQTTSQTITAATTGAAITVATAVLASTDGFSLVEDLPAQAPADLTVEVAHERDTVINNQLTITATNGNVVRVPITGRIATASYREPLSRSLGTFCIDRPTTPDVVSFQSTGTATIELVSAEMALGTQSPFDLAPEQPATPGAVFSFLGPGASTAVSITPKRSLVAGVQLDDIVWTTDVADRMTARTTISATFVDDGGAIAPSALSFGPTVIHVDTKNAQSVTLQNCDTQPIEFSTAVDVPSPFRIDFGAIPAVLFPNEQTTFTIGFHPTRKGVVSTQMELTAPQLTEPLVIRLEGEGIVTTVPPDPDVPGSDGDESSFYGCGGCASRGSAGGLLPLGALAFSLWRRRRGSS